MSDSEELQPCEVGPMARKLAEEMEGFTKFYQDVHKLSREEAERKVVAMPEELAHLLAMPADQMSWLTLSQLAAIDPNSITEVWRLVNREAKHEIESGWRAADVMARGLDFGPLDRARFLQVRKALHREWNPSPGSESMLIDMLAQIHAAWEAWLGKHLFQISLECSTQSDRERKEQGFWVPEKLSQSEAVTLSAAMADRFNKMFLRTLRALRDLRRMVPNVTVQNAGQVNVGAQQVNVARQAELGRG